MSSAEHEGLPQWKPWYRWPFLILMLIGGAMVVVGVRECIALWTAIRSDAAEIVVETAMSAFPPLGVAFVALGTIGFLPRRADGSGIAPVRTRAGKEVQPAKIAMLVALGGLLLYPICALALRAVTTETLTGRGYTVVEEDVSHTSGYMTTRWQKVGPPFN